MIISFWEGEIYKFESLFLQNPLWKSIPMEVMKRESWFLNK